MIEPLLRCSSKGSIKNWKYILISSGDQRLKSVYQWWHPLADASKDPHHASNGGGPFWFQREGGDPSIANKYPSMEVISGLKQAGVTQVSIGVQTFR